MGNFSIEGPPRLRHPPGIVTPETIRGTPSDCFASPKPAAARAKKASSKHLGRPKPKGQSGAEARVQEGPGLGSNILGRMPTVQSYPNPLRLFLMGWHACRCMSALNLMRITRLRDGLRHSMDTVSRRAWYVLTEHAVGLAGTKMHDSTLASPPESLRDPRSDSRYFRCRGSLTSLHFKIQHLPRPLQRYEALNQSWRSQRKLTF